MGQHAEKFLSLLRELQKIDSEFPLQYAICLTEIALDEGLSLTALADKTGMPLSTVSRIVGALSQNRQKGAAYDLIAVGVSTTERRKKELYLTSRGHAVVNGIVGILNEKPAYPLRA